MIELHYDFTSLNAYINAERRNKYVAAKIKKTETNFVHMSLLNKPKIATPCKLHFHWLLKNRRKDLDNVAFSKKFIIDGMVHAGIIPNDGLKYITGFTDTFEISDKVGVRIEVY